MEIKKNIEDISGLIDVQIQNKLEHLMRQMYAEKIKFLVIYAHAIARTLFCFDHTFDTTYRFLFRSMFSDEISTSAVPAFAFGKLFPS